MKWIVRIGLGLLALMLAVAVGTGFWYWQATRGPLPQLEGELSVPGLRAPVEVLRDDYGVPHIYAQNHHDLLFAQGFVQAQDRWWQMAFYRRVFSGRLGEIAGRSQDVLEADVLMRTLDLVGVAERDFAALEPGEQAYYQWFADGVNAYLSSREPEQLAFEYSVLKLQGIDIEPEPWSPVDCIAFGKLMGYTFSGRDLEREPLRQKLHEILTPEQWAIWNPAYAYDEWPTTIERDDLPQLDEIGATGEPPRAMGDVGESALPGGLPGASGLDASNAWAVDGSHTESGQPLFASDPHQGIEIPCLWYEIGLHSPPDNGREALNLYGFCAPLLPFVQTGHNDRICWGLTNVSGSDALDLFELRVNPANPMQYEWDGGWRDFEVRTQHVAYPTGDPREVEIRISHLGPVMPRELLHAEDGDKVWAIRWEGLHGGTIQKTGTMLPFARNFEAFREALRYWDYPAANIPYADVDGNIGFQQTGKFPIRPAKDYTPGPKPGWSSEHAWRGFIPYDLHPYVLNPKSGRVVAANNPVPPPEYAEWIHAQLGGGDIDARISPHAAMGYRAARITEMLEATEVATVAWFGEMQYDARLEVADRIMVTAISAGLNQAYQPTGSYAELSTDSTEAVTTMAYLRALNETLFGPALDGLHVPQLSMTSLRSLELQLESDAGFWPEEDAPDEVIRAAEQRAINMAPPVTWGDLHQANFENPFLGQSGVGVIENLVNRGGYPVPGGPGTVNIGRWSEKRGTFESRHIAAYRRIIDLADFDNSVAVNSTGQSGHPFSPHYDDQIELWATGQYRPIHFSREAVERAAKYRLVLMPSGGRE